MFVGSIMLMRDLMKDKLVAGGVSGRDPADDDDDYRIQSKLRDTLVKLKIGTIVYLSASTRSQVATAQHGDHGFPICRIVCPDKRDKRRQPNSSALSPFQKDVTTRQPHQLTFKAVSRARTTELSFYSEGLWRVVGKAASRHDQPSGSDTVL